MLEDWECFTESGVAKSSISSIIEQHIPDVMGAYLQVMAHDRSEHVKDIIGIPDISSKKRRVFAKPRKLTLYRCCASVL
ncbi:hypothetical protein [Corynebacterium sp.]|uniref:hypothetical protein n=1 Tax=Corynebacterium sp. TaxID=1720 RepID=UPI002648F6D6|nr:hypothetical protein [Corynebacterium sp.]MDN6137505.1 hypothetical protein [Corynebacterium sp.]MDN6737732.1 hypothetical protein [Corynebacterium sp.]